MPIQTLIRTSSPIVAELEGLSIHAGLNAVVGDEGSGKTHLLKKLCAANSDAIWLDLKLPEHSDHTPEEVWKPLQSLFPLWNQALCRELSDALDLTEHFNKRLSMLSAGSRRKVGLVALLASGAKITCLDQPFVALDMASIEVLREIMSDMADHASRAWVVADYELDPNLAWGNLISIDR